MPFSFYHRYGLCRKGPDLCPASATATATKVQHYLCFDAHGTRGKMCPASMPLCHNGRCIAATTTTVYTPPVSTPAIVAQGEHTTPTHASGKGNIGSSGDAQRGSSDSGHYTDASGGKGAETKTDGNPQHGAGTQDAAQPFSSSFPGNQQGGGSDSSSSPPSRQANTGTGTGDSGGNRAVAVAVALIMLLAGLVVGAAGMYCYMVKNQRALENQYGPMYVPNNTVATVANAAFAQALGNALYVNGGNAAAVPQSYVMMQPDHDHTSGVEGYEHVRVGRGSGAGSTRSDARQLPPPIAASDAATGQPTYATMDPLPNETAEGTQRIRPYATVRPAATGGGTATNPQASVHLSNLPDDYAPVIERRAPRMGSGVDYSVNAENESGRGTATYETIQPLACPGTPDTITGLYANAVAAGLQDTGHTEAAAGLCDNSSANSTASGTGGGTNLQASVHVAGAQEDIVC